MEVSLKPLGTEEKWHWHDQNSPGIDAWMSRIQNEMTGKGLDAQMENLGLSFTIVDDE